MDDKKERVIEFIKEHKEVSSGKIANYLGINFYSVETILSELMNENKIEVVQKPRGNYWKIKEVKK
jgi:predicted HTH transcriptional regulator